jgi:type VI secretion system protein ImpL
VTIKTLLFLLFLYICLVWVGAAYLHSGPELLDFGLKWTLVGLAVLFAVVIASHLLKWWRQWRAQPAPREKVPAKPAPAIHEDDAALAAAIAEANATLTKAPDFKTQSDPIFRLPWRLIIGPEGSGKTSILLNSGLEPQLLSVNASDVGTKTSTRLCNIWLAKNTIFLEISGRFFDGDLARWTQLLRVIHGTDSVPPWRRLLGKGQQTVKLRGVIACSELREYTGASADPQRFERYCRNWHDRFRAIGEVFGIRYPVYHVITKCDGIPYFTEYFRHFPEPDTRQVLGCTLRTPDASPGPGEVFAEAESKRLTKAFRVLHQSLAERRITELAHESDSRLRPDIYEFPRELKRIRGPVVQFLVDAFRPDALLPAPVLRGYYFTAVRDVESAAAPPPAPDDWQTVVSRGPLSADATGMFKMDASIPSISRERSKRMVHRWSFVADLFHRIVLADVPIQSGPPVDARFELYRRKVLYGVLGVCALLWLAFFISWMGNRALISDVENAAIMGKPRTEVTLADLRKLDALRIQLERLRNGGSWWLHLGLYPGNQIIEQTRTAYFRRFNQLILTDLNHQMTDRLKAVADEGYEPVYKTLKTHLTISSGKCPVEPALVSEVLRGVRLPGEARKDTEWQKLSDQQIEFYSTELEYGNPVPVSEDSVALEHGRQYLRKIGGVDRIYSAILANARKSLAKPKGLRDLAPNYAQVLRGPGEPPSGFAIEGWNFVVKASRDQKSAFRADCVFGDESQTAADPEIDPKKSADISPEIQRLYVQDYIQNWRDFLSGYSVLPYSSAEDAAKKLEVLSSNRSPLLALLALTASQTNFAPEGLQKSVEGIVQKVEKAAGIVPKSEKSASEVSGTSADITQFFQPVHLVVPPNSEPWVNEKNTAYMDSLAQLRGAMQNIARNTDSAGRLAAAQAAGPIYNNALNSVLQIARGFKPNGLDQVVQRLLEQPILLVQRFTDADIGQMAAAEINGKLGPVCKAFATTADKYPFRRSASQEATLEELSALFGPDTGQIWKFQVGSLAQVTQKEGSQWKAKSEPSPNLHITSEMLAFLNRAESIRNAFYAKGGPLPQITYSLRPKFDPAFTSTSTTVELEVDGQLHQFTSVFQKQFTWPAAGAAKPGAVARIRNGNVASAFLSHPGPWGVFRMMDDAEPRASGTPVIEWRYSTASGQRDPIQPAPVRMEFPDFPGGLDVFHKEFYEGIRCPTAAVRKN